jgi:hypothetical protein
MTDLRDHILFFRLTAEGIGSLRRFVPEGDGLEARVDAEKGYGLWIVPSKVSPDSAETKDEEVVLLKWAHFQTATFMRPKEGLRRSSGLKK